MKRKVVQKLIEQIEEEIGKSTDTEYITIEGDIITADVGCIADWMEEYKKILEKRYNMAIEALEEIQQYRAIGTVEECREAREKQTPKRPVWKKGRSIICKDYADGHGEVEENKWADWVCPNCGWFVGEQYIPRRHNQQKSNYCSRCGQAIQWDKNLEGMEDD